MRRPFTLLCVAILLVGGLWLLLGSGDPDRSVSSVGSGKRVTAGAAVAHLEGIAPEGAEAGQAPEIRTEAPEGLRGDEDDGEVVIDVEVTGAGGARLSGVCVRVTAIGNRLAGRGVTRDGLLTVKTTWESSSPNLYRIATTVGNQRLEVDAPGRYVVPIACENQEWIVGKVVTKDGEPIPDATIVVTIDDSCLGMQPVCRTDADGMFRMLQRRDAPTGVCARVPGYHDGPVQLARNGVVLTPGLAGSPCTIRIVGPDGQPASAWVLVGRQWPIRMPLPASEASAADNGRPPTEVWAPGREYVAADGVVEVDGLSGYNNELRVVPHDRRLARWDDGWRGTRTQEIRLEQGCVVSGRVMDGLGQPVAGAFVRVGGARDWRRPQAWTDAAGRFVIHGLPAGGQTVSASANDVRADARITARSGGRCEVFLVLGERRVVQVVAADGSPMAGTLVRVAAHGESSLAMADDDGELVVPDSWWQSLEVEVDLGMAKWGATDVVSAGESRLVVTPRR